MRSMDVKLKCFLEGREVKILSAVVSVTINTPPVAEIRLPAIKAISKIKRRTMVAIFFYDHESSSWRLWFKGEISGQQYAKHGGEHTRSLYAVSDISYMNDLPAKYMQTMDPPAIGSYEYQFYNIPLETVVDYQIKTEIINDFGFDITDNKGLIEYIKAFLRKAVGDEAFELYYKNAGERFRIADNHVLIDTGIYKTLLTAQQMQKMLKNTQAHISSDIQVLDALISMLVQYKYNYVNITSPAYNATAMAEADPSGNVVSRNYAANSLVEHVIMPENINMFPPKCNVVFSDRSSQMMVAIYENSPTRLLNNYFIIGESQSDTYGNIPAICSVYPPSLSQKSLGNECPFGGDTDPNAFSMTEEEKEKGMRPAVQNKSYLFNLMIEHDWDSRPEKFNIQVGKEAQSYWNNDVAYDFFVMKYKNNSIDITLSGFNPYIVCGLPGIVYDVDCDVFYYGEYVAYSQSVDCERGEVSVSLKLKNVREITDIREIMATRQADGSWVADKIMPFIPGSIYAPLNSSGEIALENGLSKLTTEVYRHILKGTQAKGSNQGTGWQAVTDVMLSSKGSMPLGSILDDIKKQYAENNHKYGLREIATIREYYYNALSRKPIIDNQSDKYIYTASMDILENIQLISFKDLTATRINIKEDKKLYIAECRSSVDEVLEILKERIITDD